jgi:predicted amidohydrolase
MALVLQGGRVVDPGRGLDAALDVRIEDGRIAAVGGDVSTEGAEVRRLGGALVTPGLIDGHVHVCEGVGFHGIDPDVLGVGSGVTTAYGLNNMSFDTAARVLDQDVQPHTISTDGHQLARDRLVYDLPTTMAKCLALGFTVPEVVEKATYETARLVNRPDLVPGVAVGQPANLSVLRLEEAEWQAEDSMGQRLTARQRLVPLLAIRGDEVFTPVASTRP